MRTPRSARSQAGRRHPGVQPGGFRHGEFGKAGLVQTAQLVATRYRLEEHLASGGMGEVWSAVDQLLDRRVALKLLHPNLAADDAFRRRFRAEARAAARLSHPGVVSVFDYGEDEHVTYLAMELVDGEPLSEVLRRRGTLTPEETMNLLAQSADALAAAHARGLVHRDVKPGNLLLRTDGRVKVTDFGIVRATDTTTLTVDGAVLGTVAYMSPEQVRGGHITPASDIYSLGVVAYECMTGVRPYAASDSIAVALAHLHEPVPELPPFVPAGVRSLVTSMLQKDPPARPSTASAVVLEARSLSAGAWLADAAAFEPVASPPMKREATSIATIGSDGARTAVERRGSAVGASEAAGAPVTAPEEPLGTAPLATKPLAGIARSPALVAAPPFPQRAASAPPARHALAVAAVAAACLMLAFVFATAGSRPAASARSPAPTTTTSTSTTTTSTSTTTTSTSTTTALAPAPAPAAAPAPGGADGSGHGGHDGSGHGGHDGRPGH